jgi:uncharacterized protein with PIN domain
MRFDIKDELDETKNILTDLEKHHPYIFTNLLVLTLDSEKNVIMTGRNVSDKDVVYMSAATLYEKLSSVTSVINETAPKEIKNLINDLREFVIACKATDEIQKRMDETTFSGVH